MKNPTKIFRFIYRIWLYVLLVGYGLNENIAQEFEWISDDFPNSQFLGIFEINGKYFGVVSNGASYSFDPNTIYQLSYYELEFDQPGGIKFTMNKIVSIPYPENYATIELNYIEETGLWIIAQSAVLSGGNQRYRVILCDKYFNILSEQKIDTTGYPIPFYIDSYDDKTYLLGSILGPPNELFFLQYSHSNPYYLPPIEVKQSEPRPMTAVSSMNIDERNGDMLVFYYSGIAELDTNLHQKFKLSIDEIETGYQGSVLGVNSNYFSHGLTDQGLSNFFKYAVFQKYDSLFNILTADTLGIKGHDHYPFLTKSLDYRNDEFLVGGHLDGPFAHFNFNRSIKKFYLAKYDEEMNQLWYNEYGGDRAYVLIGLKLLEDGGSFAYGFVTDTVSGLWYAYIMHVDTNGEILTSTTESTEPKPNIQIVNPGDEILRILNPDVNNTQFNLYNIQGNLLLTAELEGQETEINTNNLSVGFYPYTLIQNCNLIRCGKWFKSR